MPYHAHAHRHTHYAGLGRFDPRQAAHRAAAQRAVERFGAAGPLAADELAAAVTPGAMQEAQLLTPDGGAPGAGGSSPSVLCACYLRQLGAQARAQGMSPPSAEQRAQLEAACRSNPGAFKAQAANAGMRLSDVCESKSKTWLWVAGGVAALGAFYLLRK